MQDIQFRAYQLQESHRVEFLFTTILTLSIESRAQEVDVVHARNLNGVLEGQKETFACPFMRVKFQNVFTKKVNATCGYFIIITSSKDV